MTKNQPQYETRVMSLLVVPKGEPIFSEKATSVTITDEASGEFVSVTQTWDHAEKGTITLTSEEWPELKAAIETMINNCRKESND
jgi:hypothetical protein